MFKKIACAALAAFFLLFISWPNATEHAAPGGASKTANGDAALEVIRDAFGGECRYWDESQQRFVTLVGILTDLKATTTSSTEVSFRMVWVAKGECPEEPCNPTGLPAGNEIVENFVGGFPKGGQFSGVISGIAGFPKELPKPLTFGQFSASWKFFKTSEGHLLIMPRVAAPVVVVTAASLPAALQARAVEIKKEMQGEWLSLAFQEAELTQRGGAFVSSEALARQQRLEALKANVLELYLECQACGLTAPTS